MAAPRVRIVARVGSAEDRPLRNFLIGSFVVHLALAIAIFVVPGLLRGPRIPTDAVFVELAPAFPAAQTSAPAPKPAAAKPPEPEPETAEPEGARVETQVPKPDTKPPKKNGKPEPQPAKKSEPPPKQTPATTEPAEGAPGGEAKDESATIGGPEAGSAVASVGLGNLDSEFGWYSSQVTAALHANWQRPILQGLREPVEVGVAFRILRSGALENIRLEAPSGIPSLDRSAIRAVSDSNPLPPLPSNLRRDSLDAMYVFRMYPDAY